MIHDFAKIWFEFGNNDLATAKILFKNKAYETTILHCHQALEKHLKGGIVAQGGEVKKTHDLPALLQATGLEFPSSLLTAIEDLNAYYQPSRYPDTAMVSSLRFDRKTAATFLKTTEAVIKWLHYHNKPNK